MIEVAPEFLYWMDRAKPGGWVLTPAQNAKDAITAKAIEARVVHGRITLWLWQAQNQVKGAFAMARIAGLGGDKPVRVIHAPPPERDDDKAQLVFAGERL